MKNKEAIATLEKREQLIEKKMALQEQDARGTIHLPVGNVHRLYGALRDSSRGQGQAGCLDGSEAEEDARD